MTPRISIIVTTAREDRPWLGRPDLRTCDPVVQSVARQEGAPSSEVIIADADYRHREEQPFSETPSGMRVPEWIDCENDWHRAGRPGFCEQFNRAAREATGEILVGLAECCLLPPWLLRRIAEEHERGDWPNLLYVQDLTFGGEPAAFSGSPTPDLAERPRAEILGYRGDRVHAEHRWAPLRLESRHRPWWGWWFGYFTMPRAVFLELGGYDEATDGDFECQDNDLGSRVEMRGDGGRLVIARDLYVAEAVPRSERWSARFGPREERQPVKCNYALLKWNRTMRRLDARTPLGREADVTEHACALDGGACEVRADCAARNEFYPFASKRPEAADLLAAWRERWSTS